MDILILVALFVVTALVIYGSRNSDINEATAYLANLVLLTSDDVAASTSTSTNHEAWCEGTLTSFNSPTARETCKIACVYEVANEVRCVFVVYTAKPGKTLEEISQSAAPKLAKAYLQTQYKEFKILSSKIETPTEEWLCYQW